MALFVVVDGNMNDDHTNNDVILTDFDGTWIPISTSGELAMIGSTGNSGAWPLNGKYYLTNDIIFGDDDHNTGHTLRVHGLVSADGTSAIVNVTNPHGTGSANRINTLHVSVETAYGFNSHNRESSQASVEIPLSDVKDEYTITVAGQYRMSGTNLEFAYTFILDRSGPGQTLFDITFKSNGNMNPLPAGFTGILDGNGHVISGMEIAVFTTSNSSIGLFRSTAGSNAEIRNLGVVDSTITAVTGTRTLNVGGLVGNASAGTQIINSHFEGLVVASSTTGTLNVGGLIGNAPNGATVVRDSYNSGDITARTNSAVSNAGGIMGLNGGQAQVINSYNAGSISASTLARAIQSAGGIIGFAANTTIVTNCYNMGSIFASSFDANTFAGGITGRNGTISGSGNMGSVHAENVDDSNSANITYAGGITGFTARPISNCYNTGEITSISRQPYAGGIVGSSTSASSVSMSFNMGDIRAEGTGTLAVRVGGIAGYTAGPINNSYNTGNISAETNSLGSGTVRAGGIAGETKQVIRNSYSVGTVDALILNGSTPLVGGIAGNVSNSSARMANVYFLQNTVVANGVTMNQLTAGGTTSAVNNIDGGALAHNPLRLVPQMSYTAKTVEQMKPDIEVAKNNGSIFYTGTIGAGTAAITGWNFDTIWTIDPTKNNGFPILQSRAADLTIDEHPVEEHVLPGDSATFTVSASTTPQINHILYQWQISTDFGETWSDIPGAVSHTLRVTQVTYAMDDNMFRSVVSSLFGFEISNPATLFVTGAKKMISGTITHDDGHAAVPHPLPGVTVNFTVNGLPNSVISDHEGIYRITAAIGSDVVITSLSKDGFEESPTCTADRTFPDIGDDHSANNFSMLPDGTITTLEGTILHKGHPLGGVVVSFQVHVDGDLRTTATALSVLGVYEIAAPFGSVVTITSIEKEHYEYEGVLPLSIYIHEPTERNFVMVVDSDLLVNVAGTVSEYLSGDPLADVRIVYTIEYPDGSAWHSELQVFSGSNGSFIIPQVPFGSDIFIKEVLLDGFVRVGMVYSVYIGDTYANGSAEPIELFMSSVDDAHTLSGPVLFGAVQLVGAQVFYTIDGLTEGFVIANDGTYSIYAWPGQWIEITNIVKEGFIPLMNGRSVFMVQMEDGDITQNLYMTPDFETTFRITGSVIHEGNSIPGVVVSYTVDGILGTHAVTTDANGIFVISAESGQTVRITGATKIGYNLISGQVPIITVVQGNSTTTMFMVPFGDVDATLSGVVYDGSRPIAGVTVTYMIGNGPIQQLITDGRGSFEIHTKVGLTVTILSLDCVVMETMPMNIYMHGDRTQNFFMVTYGAGSVTITLTPGNFFNGSIYWSTVGGNNLDNYFKFEGELSFLRGAQIHIWAVPDADYNFLRWTGAAVNSPNDTATLTMTSNATLGAVFWREMYTLTPVDTTGNYTLHITVGNGPERPFTGPETHPEGSIITLRVQTDAGYHFSYWTGVAALGNPYTFDLDGNYLVGAVLYHDTDTVFTITPGAQEGGTVYITLGGMQKALNQQVTLLAGTVVPVAALGDDGFGFSYWTGSLFGNVNPRNVTLNGNMTIGAVFYDNDEVVELSLGTISGTGTGQIRWSVDGVNFTVLTNEAVRFPAGTAITIDTSGSTNPFLFWLGEIGGNDHPRILVMDADYEVGAMFGTGHTITVTQHLRGQIYWYVYTVTTISTPDGPEIVNTPLNAPTPLRSNTITVPNGTWIAFEADGNGSWEFTEWDGNLVIDNEDADNHYLNNPIYVQINADNRTLFVYFDTNVTFTLTPGVISGGGMITVSIPEMSIVDQPLTAPITGIKDGFEVIINATGTAGSTFSHWVGVPALGALHSFEIDGDYTIGAVFYTAADTVYTLTPETTVNGTVYITIGNGGPIEFTQSVTLKAGTEVTFRAESDMGYDFLRWIGLYTLRAEHTFSVSENLTISAAFYSTENTVMLMPKQVENGLIYFAYGDGTDDRWMLFDYNITLLIGTEVSVRAVAAGGHVFSYWTGIAASGAVHTFVADRDHDIGAVFIATATSNVTLTPGVHNNGKMFITVGGTEWEFTNSVVLANGTPVTIRAVADGGHVFSYWTGIAASGSVHTFDATANRTIGALFIETSASNVILAPSITGSGKAYITLGGIEREFTESVILAEGTQVTVRAAAAFGQVFSHWTGIEATTPTHSFPANASVTVGAVFIPDPLLNSTFAPGDSNNGKLFITIDGVETEFTENVTVLNGTEVTIRAVADSGFVFSYLTGIAASGAVHTFTANGNLEIGAVFIAIAASNVTITPAESENGKLFITLGGLEREFTETVTVIDGKGVIIRAVADRYHEFSHWIGSDEETHMYSFVACETKNDRNIGAVFIYIGEDDNNIVWIALAILVAALIVAGAILAYGRYYPTGTVRHDGKGAEGVKISYTVNGDAKSTVTNSKGKYRLDAPNDSEVVIREISSENGEASEALPIEFVMGKNTRYDFNMK